MKQEFCDFIGKKAFETDGGWSYEVWQAAWQACLNQMKDTQQCNVCGSIVVINNQPDLLSNV
jgi:hypothetical protein